MVNHESIHLKQQAELLVVGFWILYLANWVFNIVKYKFDFFEAYMNIIFEKEAYAKEEDFEYLKKRRPFSWVRF